MDPRTAIAEWKAAEPTAATGLRLMRHLIAHPRWLFVVDDAEAARLLEGAGALAMHCDVDAQGQRWRPLFSDDDAMSAYLDEIGIASANQAAVAGHAAFSCLEQIDKLSINPFTPHTVTYSRPQFEGLEEVRNALALEGALTQLHATDAHAYNAELLSRVKRFPSYVVCLREADGQRQLCLTADEGHGEHAAVFTLEDAAWAYADRVRAAGADGELAASHVPGDRLFELLLRLDLTGIHFNPEGPSAALRFSIDFARSVLAAG